MGIGYQPNNNNTYARKSQHNTDSSAVLRISGRQTYQHLLSRRPQDLQGHRGLRFLSSFSYGSTDDLRSLLKGSGKLDLGPEEKCMVTGDYREPQCMYRVYAMRMYSVSLIMVQGLKRVADRDDLV